MAVLEKRPMMERTRICSERPAIPGQKQGPRTIEIDFDAGLRSLVQRANNLGSSSAFILAMIWAGLPCLARSVSRAIHLSKVVCKVNGDWSRCLSRPGCPREVSC